MLEGADFSFDYPKDRCLTVAALLATGIVEGLELSAVSSAG